MMAVTFEKMCDRCYRMLGDNEPIMGFKLIDDKDRERVFKGHEVCVQEMMDIMQQLYGKKENVDNDK